MKIQIRKVTEMEEIYPILDLMQDVWQLHDREVVASFEMKAVAQFGLLLGAYDVDIDANKPIGFIFVFNKFPDIHYSHMMGIQSSYRGKNVGFLLKKYHREIALQETNPAISAIEWTVDPLLSINAQLNFRKLGVRCSNYHENFYGAPTAVGLYPSLPTDRILVRWLIRSSRVTKRFSTESSSNLPWSTPDDLSKSMTVLTTFISDHALLQPFELTTKPVFDSDPIALEIPDKFTELSRIHYDWALQWRLFTRLYFQEFFKHNYFLVDYLSFKTDNSRRNFYLFTRKVSDYEY